MSVEMQTDILRSQERLAGDEHSESEEQVLSEQAPSDSTQQPEVENIKVKSEAMELDTASPDDSQHGRDQQSNDRNSKRSRTPSPTEENQGRDSKRLKQESDEDIQEQVWVQCDNPSCKKWRRLPRCSHEESAMLPDRWYCDMNRWDPERASCLAPAEGSERKKKGKKRSADRNIAAQLLTMQPTQQPLAAAQAAFQNQLQGLTTAQLAQLSMQVPSHSQLLSPQMAFVSPQLQPMLNPYGALHLLNQSHVQQLQFQHAQNQAIQNQLHLQSQFTSNMREEHRERDRERGERGEKAEKERGSGKKRGAPSKKNRSGKQKEADTWVQCDKCSKWRKLPAEYSSEQLPETWFCSMHPKLKYRSCDAPDQQSDDDSNKKGVQRKVSTGKTRRDGMNKPTTPKPVTPKQSNMSNMASNNANINSSSSSNNYNSSVNHNLYGLATTPVEDDNWVQCERKSCLKWRRLPSHVKPGDLPEQWYCDMNHWDPLHASCSADEEVVENRADSKRGKLGNSTGQSYLMGSGSGKKKQSDDYNDEGGKEDGQEAHAYVSEEDDETYYKRNQELERKIFGASKAREFELWFSTLQHIPCKLAKPWKYGERNGPAPQQEHVV